MSNLRKRLVGLLALLGLLGIVLGLPGVLLALGASPIPHTLPSLETLKSVLSSPDDGTMALTAIKVIAWAAWLFLTVSVLLELVSRARGISAPHLPGLRMPQSAARGLVSAAALLFIAAPMGVQAATAAPAPAAPAAVSTAVAGQYHLTAAVPAPAKPPPATPATQTPATGTAQHTVKQGETLWSIAQEHLGAGTRYREIVSLNSDRLSGAGSFIKAGWVLDIPFSAPAPAAPAAGGGSYTVQRGDTLSAIAQDKLGDASRYPEIARASAGIVQPGGAHLANPDVIDTGWTLQIPSTTPTASPARVSPVSPSSTPTSANPTTGAPGAPAAQSAPAPVAPRPAQPSTPAQPAPSPGATSVPATAAESQRAPAAAADQVEQDTQWPVRTGYGVGALLAAGVLALIATRRRTQQRRRRPGQRLPMPEGAVADVEQELRATADTLSVATVDVALRSLARDCATSGAPLPVVRAGRLTADQFDLYLAEPATLPTPWTGTADATVWTLEVENTVDLHANVDGVPAPYPALVTIGHDEEDGHVFLDLEYLGALGIAGEPERTREILAALAIELATSTWADDLQVTIVGAYPELEDALQTGRIRYLPSVGRILDELTARAGQDRAAMEAEHTPDLQHARVSGAVPDAWSPEIVLIAGAITTRQRNQLEGLVDELPRVALAAITSGVSVGEWILDLEAGDSDDQAVLSPIGLQIRPQRIPAEQYGHILELAAFIDAEDLPGAGTVEPEPTLAQVSTITPVDDAGPAGQPAEGHVVQESANVSESDTAPAVSPHVDPVAADNLMVTTAGSTPDAIDDPVADTEEVLTEGALKAPAAAADHLAAETGTETPSAAAPEAAVTPEQAPSDAAATGSQEAPTAVTEVRGIPIPAPVILVLGPVEMANPSGKVEPSKKARLLEYAAYLALNPGAGHTAIDDAIWPNRKTQENLNTRNTATSKLRSWIGKNPLGEDYLPRHQAGNGYAFLPSVRTDVDSWNELLAAGPLHAPSDALAAALELVRGRPFEGHHPRYYVWSERIAQRMISEIVDASYELARRRLMEGRWRAAEEAVVVGLSIEPAQERLWRMRILAAHESRNAAAEKEAIDRMLTITQELECDLEPETETLLAALQNPRAEFDQLMADAL